MTLPDHYPFAAAPISDVLLWAHSIDPPFNDIRAAALWLQDNADVRAYLDGVIEGNIYRGRYGPLFATSDR